jgi:glyceraldehyde 3-phosphate dehydrogenase
VLLRGRRNNERVDLGECAVLLGKQLRQPHHHLHGLPDLLALEAQFVGDAAGLEALKPEQRMQRFLEDRLGMAIRIGINGFGRIGRLVYRIAAEQGIEIVAVNDLVPADNLAYLLKYDTMHRQFMLGGKPPTSPPPRTRSPSTARPPRPWPRRTPPSCRGRTWASLRARVHRPLHRLREGQPARAAGAKRVIISAPTKSEPAQVPTLCLGVNHEKYDAAKHTVVSNASVHHQLPRARRQGHQRQLRLEEGLMTTIHAATATQPTQDGPSKKDWRGGRNAYQNIIPASTGAAKAVTLCIPALKGKLTGMSFRVPTADVSCVDLTFKTGQGHERSPRSTPR